MHLPIDPTDTSLLHTRRQSLLRFWIAQRVFASRVTSYQLLPYCKIDRLSTSHREQLKIHLLLMLRPDVEHFLDRSFRRTDFDITRTANGQPLWTESPGYNPPQTISSVRSQVEQNPPQY